MVVRILVAYATRNGSTGEIAHAAGRELSAAGHAVDVAELKTISTLAGYNAVVMGGPLYMGSIDDAVGKYKDQLAHLPVAAFGVGLAPVSKDAKQMVESMKALHASVAPLQPVAETLFAGKLDPSRLSFVQRKMTEFVKSPVGDFRDWNAIAAWAKELPGKMKL
ncbi:MAG: flavodoxin [Methanoregula sp.]|nr:flavodoxin [Methanoregula sp.]